MPRGFGIPATDDEHLVRRLAHDVEAAGYRTFWSNDTPAHDGLRTLKWASDGTSLRLGVGVIAVDRRSPEEIAAAVEDLDLPLHRLVLGVGAGFSPSPLSSVRSATAALREVLGTSVTLAVAAMGPRMCRLAGEVGDVVLLNWMTPARIAWARQRVAEGGEAEMAAYVRVAAGADAADRLAQEATGYASMLHYARHFEAMNTAPGEVGVVATDSVMSALREYDAQLDETVVRALPAAYSHEALASIARLAAGQVPPISR